MTPRSFSSGGRGGAFSEAVVPHGLKVTGTLNLELQDECVSGSSQGARRIFDLT